MANFKPIKNKCYTLKQKGKGWNCNGWNSFNPAPKRYVSKKKK